MHVKAQRDDLIQSELRAGWLNNAVQVKTNLLPVSEIGAMLDAKFTSVSKITFQKSKI